MIDFRYHIVSIVAIFFALGAGVVLGAGPLKGTGSDIIQAQADRDRAALEDVRSDLIEAKALDKYRDDYVAKVATVLVDTKLKDRRVAIVTMPQADGDQVDAVTQTLQRAGAQVTTRVALDARLFESANRQLVDSLVSQLASADLVFPKNSTTYQRAGLVLARGIAAKGDDRAIDDGSTKNLTGLGDAKLLSVKPTPKERANLIVVVAAKPPTPTPENSAYNDGVDLAEGLDLGSDGVVVAGTRETAADGGLLKALRGDSSATELVSSVDVADLPSGQATIVFALVEQLGGKAGQYGAVDAKNGVAPSAFQQPDN